MNKLAALFRVMQYGQRVADPATWKQRQVLISVLAPFILALVALGCSYGFCLPISEETAIALASAAFGAVNIGLTWATSKKVGPGKKIENTENESGV